MRTRVSTLVAVVVSVAASLVAADTVKRSAEHWEIAGDLTEACTCAVPCTCNFGGGPSPKHYCWSMFSLGIEKGHYGKVALDGMHLAGTRGKRADVWYIDDRASSEQAAALKSIAGRFLRGSGHRIYFETAHITQKVGEKGNKLDVGGHGGFEADYIIGLDGKTPVVVENNTTWNIPRSIKGSTKQWRYRDPYGNKFDLSATNSNQGKFDWTDETEHYF